MKLISRAAGLAAATLVAGTLAAIPMTSANAESKSLNYTCTDPLGQSRVFTVVFDTDAPATIEAGKSFTPAMKANVTVDAETSTLLRNVGAVSVEGTTKDGKSTELGYSVNGVAATTAGTIPVTGVPATGNIVVPATATGAAITPAAAGTLKIEAGNFTAVLAGKTSTGGATPLSPYSIPCVLDAGQDATIDTVTVTAAPAPEPEPEPEPVVKADTKTLAKGKYIAKKKMIRANITVRGGETKATGKVRVVVKKGKKTVKKLTRKLNSKGKAVAKVKKINKKGKYKVIVTYLGDDTHKRSKKKVVVKVA